MKLEQSAVPFRPVTITIESPEELVSLWAALASNTIGGCKESIRSAGIDERYYKTAPVDRLWRDLCKVVTETVVHKLGCYNLYPGSGSGIGNSAK